MNRLKDYFLAGLVVLLPAVATLYICWILFRKIDGILGGLIHRYTGHHIYGVGFVTVLLIILLLGIVASNYFGRRLVSVGDHAFAHVPFMSRLYGAMKQISETVFSRKAQVFRRVVLVEFPQVGSYSIAFVTAEEENAFYVSDEGPYLHVFVPTPPNPTAGFLLIVPSKRVIPLDIPLDDALKFVLSGGAVVPAVDLRQGAKREGTPVA
jgi:uncharacterized membrane protein